MSYSYETSNRDGAGGYTNETQVLAAARRYLRKTGQHSARIFRDEQRVGVLRNDGFGNRRSIRMDYDAVHDAG